MKVYFIIELVRCIYVVSIPEIVSTELFLIVQSYSYKYSILEVENWSVSDDL
jgi:hypothetical protein